MIKFVCGLMGAGKTTFIKQNAKENEIILDWDYLRKTFNDKDNKITTDTLNYALQLCVSKDCDCWISGVLPTDQELEILKGYDVEWYLINTSIERSLNNVKQRDRNNEKDEVESFRLFNEYSTRRLEIFQKEYKPTVINLFEVTKERW